MENCFVTRLKGSVNNPNLEYLNAVDIVVSAAVSSGAQLRIGALNDNEVHLSIPNGVSLTKGGTTLTGECYLPKDTNSSPSSWDIWSVANTTGTEQIIHLTNVNKLRVFGATAPSSGVTFSKMNVVSAYNDSMVTVLLESQNNIYGNFEIFGNNTHIGYFQAAFTGIKGDLLKFISNAVKAGRTTGSCNISSSIGSMTVGRVIAGRLQGSQSWEPSGNNYLVTYHVADSTPSENTCVMDVDGNLVEE